VWASLVVIGAGFGGVLLGWSIVAGTDDASDQVVPTLGLGVGGFALVVLGTALLLAAVAHRDAVLLARLRRGDGGSALRVPPRTRTDRAFDAVLVLVAVLGLAAMVLGAHGAAREDDVQFARPYLLSGGLGGLSLLVAALGVLAVRVRRRRTIRAHATTEVVS
jgi:hypothetical protein